MRAIICTRYGPPEVLRLAEVERPTPRRNQVRIRIFATAVTVSDCVIRGLRAPRRYRLLLRLLAGWNAPRRKILGMVLAGDVESVGRNVTAFKEGDPVMEEIVEAHRYVELGHKKGNVIVTVGPRS
ncbi:MAG: hypothetical protein WAM82_30055 [Thermoanaerobaculia bacterium]